MGEWIIIEFEETKDGDYIYHCKMPENNQHVLVWYSGYPKVDICTIDKYGDYCTESGNEFAERVTAWMPITDPHEKKHDKDVDDIKNLQSITPQPKIGYWIKKKPYPMLEYDYECSECGHDVIDKTPYCSDCGAKMKSEDKE